MSKKLALITATAAAGLTALYLYKKKKSNFQPMVIVGPSGVGKGTLIEKLEKEYGAQLGRCVSHTTRKPRPGEVDGVNYHYTSVDDFKKGIDAGEFLEYNFYAGNYYGTSFRAMKDVEKQGKICILEIDPEGAKNVKKEPSVSANYLFLLPPSVEELERRLRSRQTDSEDSILKRLQTSTSEIAFIKSNTSMNAKTLVNEDLTATYAAFVAHFQSLYPQLR